MVWRKESFYLMSSDGKGKIKLLAVSDAPVLSRTTST
jgi:hypothetical protein